MEEEGRSRSKEVGSKERARERETEKSREETRREIKRVETQDV
jgi:hypothetical protein